MGNGAPFTQFATNEQQQGMVSFWRNKTKPAPSLLSLVGHLHYPAFEADLLEGASAADSTLPVCKACNVITLKSRKFS